MSTPEARAARRAQITQLLTEAMRADSRGEGELAVVNFIVDELFDLFDSIHALAAARQPLPPV